VAPAERARWVEAKKVAQLMQRDVFNKKVRIVLIKKIGEPLILVPVENNVGLSDFRCW